MRAHQPVERRSGTAASDDSSSDISPETVITLVSDEHVRELLHALQNRSKSARALAEECDISRATVYRRLNCLQEAGLVDEQIEIGDNGQHRNTYSIALETVAMEIELNDSGFTATLTTGEGELSTHS